MAAKEFITYYKDEPLYVEDEAAELYTIESVNGDQAVLSDRSDAMPSNTPMLVYNKSNETKVILLIPCAEPDMAITVAPEFQGTLTGTTIAASTEGQTNYAFNGKAFVFVKECHRGRPQQGMAEHQQLECTRSTSYSTRPRRLRTRISRISRMATGTT